MREDKIGMLKDMNGMEYECLTVSKFYKILSLRGTPASEFSLIYTTVWPRNHKSEIQNSLAGVRYPGYP